MSAKAGAKRMGRPRRPASRVLAVVALVVGGAIAVGCSDPDRAILARLDEAGRVRFQAGRRVAVPCWTCHDLAGDVKKVGPSLVGLYGRRSGFGPNGYVGSDAMRAASIVWDDRMLGAYLANPAGFVPGNRMVAAGIGDAAALADLLFYLRHVTEPGAREPRD